jgi:hypothetical protein
MMPLKAALYTGVAYGFAVIRLSIFLYTFYIITAKGVKFWKRFLEMALIFLSIAVIGFFAGLGLKMFLGVDV